MEKLVRVIVYNSQQPVQLTFQDSPTEDQIIEKVSIKLNLKSQYLNLLGNLEMTKERNLLIAAEDCYNQFIRNLFFEVYQNAINQEYRTGFYQKLRQFLKEQGYWSFQQKLVLKLQQNQKKIEYFFLFNLKILFACYVQKHSMNKFLFLFGLEGKSIQYKDQKKKVNLTIFTLNQQILNFGQYKSTQIESDSIMIGQDSKHFPFQLKDKLNLTDSLYLKLFQSGIITLFIRKYIEKQTSNIKLNYKTESEAEKRYKRFQTFDVQKSVDEYFKNCPIFSHQKIKLIWFPKKGFYGQNYASTIFINVFPLFEAKKYDNKFYVSQKLIQAYLAVIFSHQFAHFIVRDLDLIKEDQSSFYKSQENSLIKKVRRLQAGYLFQQVLYGQLLLSQLQQENYDEIVKFIQDKQQKMLKLKINKKKGSMRLNRQTQHGVISFQFDWCQTGRSRKTMID